MTAGVADRLPSHRGIHQRFNGTLHVSARVDYAMRALMSLAHEALHDPDQWVKSEALGREHGIPPKFLENILRKLRQDGIVASQRGADGGFRLAQEPRETTVADVIRSLDGPLVSVRGEAPEDLDYGGDVEPLRDLWVATRAALREVLEHVTLADLAGGHLPGSLAPLLVSPGAWLRR